MLLKVQFVLYYVLYIMITDKRIKVQFTFKDQVKRDFFETKMAISDWWDS